MVGKCLVLSLFLLGALAWSQDNAGQEEPVKTNQPSETAVAGDAGEDIGNQTVPDYDEDPLNASSVNGISSLEPNPENLYPVTRGTYVKALGSLLVVLGLVLGLSWVVKKYFPNKLMGATGGNNLRLVQNLPLGPNRFVSLVEADGQRLLIGVTETQINLIKSLDEIPFEQALAEAQPPKTVRELMEEGAS